MSITSEQMRKAGDAGTSRRTGWTRPTALQVLVIGGATIAPLNLLLIKSFTVYDLAIGVAWLMLVYQRRLLRPPMRYLVAAYVFVLAALVSAFRATYPIEALTQILQYAFIFFVLIPVVLSVVRTRRAVLASLFFLCLGTLGAILLAFITRTTQGADRVLVFYSDNPNRLGYPGVYLLPFLLVLWFTARRLPPGRRLLAAIACLGSGYLVVWALAASASRSSLIGTLVALVVFVVLQPGIGPGRRLVRTGTLCAAVPLIGMVLARAGHLPTTLEDRIERSLTAGEETGLLADRENLVEAGLRAFFDSPFVGTGLDNFRYVAVDYSLDVTPQIPHNLWLQLLVQVGVFGALAFAAVLLMWVCDLFRAHRAANHLERSMAWAMVAAMTGVLTIFMFAPELLNRHYWLIVALGLAVVERVRRDGREEAT